MTTVLVTGVGGNVAQGILRVIRLVAPDLRLIGTNTQLLSAGNHLCDAVYEVPYAWDSTYIDRMVSVSAQEAVSLIIPSTDFEAYHLGVAAGRLPKIVASDPATTEVFLDKHLTAQAFERLEIPFARSQLPSGYDGSFLSTVVKPRKGRGSRDVHFDPVAPDRFPDSFVVQERVSGREATCAFYVDRHRELHGLIVLERSLENGTTVACTVVEDQAPVFAQVVDEMVAGFAIEGPCNVQAIIRDDGTIVPFEVNCRFSGTASIRHHFGFRDVEFALDEFLLGRDASVPRIEAGSAVRVLLDVIYPAASYADIARGSAEHFVF